VTVAAVVPHWNRADLLTLLLENLKRQSRSFDRVIVADNGSGDDSARIAEGHGAHVVQMGANLGFAPAVNRGIEAAQCDWVAILNNDVTLDARWLEILLDAAQRGNAYFATGKILSAARPEILDGAFDEIACSGCAWRCGAGHPDAAVWNQRRRIRIAPMTAVLFRRSLFDRVGLLDERFESYLEDVDFGIRCSLQGLSGIYVPEAVCWHRGSATRGEWNYDTVRQIARNQILLAAKYLRGQPRWPIVAGRLLWGLVALRHGRPLAYLAGRLQGRLHPLAPAGRSHPPAPAAPRPAPEAVRVLLEESERTIFELQQQSGFDLYWRIYFWLLRR
jgi:GT2 family glycosyltransferase